jgi:regulator of nucleoside diphosphate kinase
MRNKTRIYMTEPDVEKLNRLLDTIDRDRPKDNGFAEQLKKEMRRARVVSPGHIAGDVVTLNSRIRIKDLDTGEDFVFQVVLPAESDPEQGKISVLAPVGTALLGYRTGDAVSWQVPSGIRKFRIEEMLYQPETEGDFFQ